MKNSLAITGALFVALSPAAVAESGFYAEAGYARYGIDVVEQDFDPGAAQVRGGYMFTPNFGVELEGATGLHDASVSDAGTRLTIELDYIISANLIGRYPLSDRLQVLGRIGHQTIDLTVIGEATGEDTVRQSGDDDGFVFGLGLEYQFDQFGVSAGYTRADEASPFPSSDRIEVLSIGLTRRF
ncbi:MAG: porin family protein [Pseudomonadota bacterium]